MASTMIPPLEIRWLETQQCPDGSTDNTDDDTTPIPTMAISNRTEPPRFCIRCDAVFLLAVRTSYDTIPGIWWHNRVIGAVIRGTHKVLHNVLLQPSKTQKAYPFPLIEVVF